VVTPDDGHFTGKINPELKYSIENVSEIENTNLVTFIPRKLRKAIGLNNA
jgi:hypothetical protein